MERAIYWEPAREPELINFAYQGQALEALQAYFGQFPIVLTAEHLPVLRAMRTCGGGRPLGDFISLIERHGSIRVWWRAVEWNGGHIRPCAAVLDAEADHA